VIGFGLLGLCSRTLLAQHRARAAGAVLITAWGVVIVAVLGLRLIVPAAWQVPALAGSVSFGMCAGAAVGAVLARPMSWLGSSVFVGLVAAAAAGSLTAWPASLFRDSGLITASAAAFAAAAGCLLIFLGVVFVLDRRQFDELRALVAQRRAPAARS
jgi:putative peptidoglycan lipid II flippase